MHAIPNNVDWSATAAWIALVISITGTIIGPIITAILTNRHELKMYRLSISDKDHAERRKVFYDCISSIGSFLSNPSTPSMNAFGENFHKVYIYVPIEKWPVLDSFYSTIVQKDYTAARQQQTEIIHLLSAILKEEFPKHP